MAGSGIDDRGSQRMLVQDPRRLRDVEQKHERVRQFLAAQGADGLLLQDPSNIAWFTAGADLSRCASDSCRTSVFVTEDARLFATNAVDSALVFEREAFGLGFQLKQREWFQPHEALVDDLCRGRRVISDSGSPGTGDVLRSLAAIRLPLTPLEVQRLRRLSRVLVHAVEVSARNIRQGVTEAAVAGEIGHRLIKRTVSPCRIQVCADGRNERYRHWSFGEDPVREYASVSCVARRWGLHLGVTRTVCLNQIPDELRTAHEHAAMVHATGQFFSLAGQRIDEIWPKVHRIYEKFGLENEWQLADQADVVGYRSSEQRFFPRNDHRLMPPTAVFWHPSVGPAMMGDSILIQDGRPERLTVSESGWPELTVQVKGRDVTCPAILRIRDPGEFEERTAEQRRPPAYTDCDLSDELHDASPMDSVWELDLLDEPSEFDRQAVGRPRQSVPD